MICSSRDQNWYIQINQCFPQALCCNCFMRNRRKPDGRREWAEEPPHGLAWIAAQAQYVQESRLQSKAINPDCLLGGVFQSGEGHSLLLTLQVETGILGLYLQVLKKALDMIFGYQNDKSVFSIICKFLWMNSSIPMVLILWTQLLSNSIIWKLKIYCILSHYVLFLNSFLVWINIHSNTSSVLPNTS